MNNRDGLGTCYALNERLKRQLVGKSKEECEEVVWKYVSLIRKCLDRHSLNHDPRWKSKYPTAS